MTKAGFAPRHVDEPPVMTDVAVSGAESRSRRNTMADTFAKSIFLIGFLMVLQRGIGFLRSFYVCGALTAEQVGRWDLAFNFLVIAAPLAVLGIPGSFGRYLARLERDGRQFRFLRQTLLVCLTLAAAASSLAWWFDHTIARYFFGSTAFARDVRLLAVCLPAVIFFNFATSWFSGKRLNRFVFRIQFAQTAFFAVLCVVGFRFFAASAASVVVAYGLSCLAGLALAASYWLVDREPEQPHGSGPLPVGIWNKLLPFAIWVWVSNALTNLFAMCDRMLLVNFYPEANADVQFLIGQYHTACLFPLLLTTVGAMAASTGMPYLSRDWEAGDRESVCHHLNAMLKAMGLICLTAAVAIQLLAPLMFGVIWQDKFAVGEALLPITLCFCSLAAVSVVAQNYFWCIEKTWIGSGLLLVGLVVNFGFGWVLIDSFGIGGVASSTLIAHAIVLAAVLILCRLQGLKLDVGVYVVCIALLSIAVGKLAAAIALALLVLLTWSTSLLVDAETKRRLWNKLARSV